MVGLVCGLGFDVVEFFVEIVEVWEDDGVDEFVFVGGEFGGDFVLGVYDLVEVGELFV